ncbi:hypothetical protein ACIU1J_32215 [Azospirillum doebereinerae]|uniref:hypothetical protein n=1 Tax=Azospirillum doebereinerae TaxID=92933 RepID=UPI001EE5DA68|nr:hypothetical protein [Azospirillum doebereinerae]MCG5238393.1 hypothetical protein [Azospirillum doebereinerae]
MRALVPLTEWTLAALMAAVIEARPSASPRRLVAELRDMNALLPPHAGGTRRLARILSEATEGIGDPCRADVRWHRDRVGLFILSWRFELVSDWTRDALNDWFFGRRQPGPLHPWILAERARRHALTAAPPRRAARGKR